MPANLFVYFLHYVGTYILKVNSAYTLSNLEMEFWSLDARVCVISEITHITNVTLGEINYH